MNNELRPYGEYKDTNTLWVREIPKHWKQAKAKRLFKETSVKNYPDEELLSVTQNQGVIPRTKLETRVVMPMGNLESFKLVEKDNFVISLRSFQGGIEHSKYRGIVSPAYTVLKPTSNDNTMYWRYLLKSSPFVYELQRNVTGIRQGKNIDVRDFKEITLPIPTISEQKQIVKYLDFKLSQINKLIKAKKILILVLREQKQAIINKSVIKGIKPNAKMKSSGVDWLGDIPEHWNVRKLRYLSTKFGSGVTPKGGATVYVETGIPFLRSQNVHNDLLLLDNVSYITEDIHQQMHSSHVQPEDVLLNITGASIGRACVVPKEINEANVNQHVCIIRPIQRLIRPRFLTYFLLTPYIQDQIIMLQNGASREGLPLKVIKNFNILLPSISEQDEILDSILKQTEKINKSIEVMDKEIKLIIEYRNSLISDVVTGKIDVRGIEVPEVIEEEVELNENDDVEEVTDDEEVIEECM